jgi:hypothetical protein
VRLPGSDAFEPGEWMPEIQRFAIGGAGYSESEITKIGLRILDHAMPCPVTPQELRDMAEKWLRLAIYARSKAEWEGMRAEASNLRRLADWLEAHDD